MTNGTDYFLNYCRKAKKGATTRDCPYKDNQVMEYLFNELSATNPAEDKAQAMAWMQTLLKTCKAAHKLGFTQLRVRHDFLQTTISRNYTILDWLRETDFDSQALLMGIRQSPPIGKEIQEEKYIYMEQIVLANDEENQMEQEAEGLGVAYLTNQNGTLAVSFDSDFKWDKTEIALIYRFLKEGKSCEACVKVKHASKPKHLNEHKIWALKKKSLSEPYKNLKPSLHNFLPNKKISNQLVDGDWNKFREQLAQYPDSKNALIQEMAAHVAEINGYQFNQSLSSHNQKMKNSLRFIYEAGEGNQKIYLSTDFEKGAFEVCNYRGTHLGEYSFNEEKTGKAKSDHNIDLLC